MITFTGTLIAMNVNIDGGGTATVREDAPTPNAPRSLTFIFPASDVAVVSQRFGQQVSITID
jgi:hypothetical protein